MDQPVKHDVSLFSDHDIYLFREGSHSRLHQKLGSHRMVVEGVDGVLFAVWAPNATRVSVLGDFNGWRPGTHELKPRSDSSGIWEGFLPGVEHGAAYKYHIVSRNKGQELEKGDPYAAYWETPPRTASRVWDLDYQWDDGEWMRGRAEANTLEAPWSIYELHLGSWRRVPQEDNRSLTYRELADQLPAYLVDMGFTHVELMPPTEHPFYGSWGYQCTGFFAPTARYGTPQDFMFLIDRLHQHGIGVIMDWVPSHFPGDGHGLVYFDGTDLYEHEDPRRGYHPEWSSNIFNYGRHEVRAFLLSSGVFWLEQYHVDALRVDAVASMLYLDYARKEGEWIPNQYGGRENLEAVDFLRALNEAAYRDHPGVQVIAEESTAWPMVSRPTFLGGLGFGMKWNMGWMHDTLDYFAKDAVHRKYHHEELTFSIWYAFSENFVLALSHDEVVYGKGSLLNKMPGDDWQRFANLRAMYGYMWTHPGKKLLFMGGEIGQWNEWHHETSLDWDLLEYDSHAQLRQWMRDLNHLYRGEPALWQLDFDQGGFEWVDCHDHEQSVISYLRKARDDAAPILVVCNLTPVPRLGYRVGVPQSGFWREILNSDGEAYGGSGCGNFGGVEAVAEETQGRPFSLTLTLPPLSVVLFKPGG